MQDLTSAQTVDAMLSARRRAWMAEAEEFELAAHFADLHPGEAVEQQQQPAGSAVVLFGEKSVRPGHDGTPEV
ncbi:MAG: hypothetical protein WAV52_03250, partial [Luteococcus japonicus]